MDYHHLNMVSVTGEYHQDHCSKLGPFQFSSTLHDHHLSSAQTTTTTTTEVDASLEWLSAYVEECLSTKGSSLPPAASTQLNKPPITSLFSSNFAAVPSKARSKRRRATSKINIAPFIGRLNSLHNKQITSSSSDPLLLQQTYWLADSELLLPHKAGGGGGGGGGERGKLVVDTDMGVRETIENSLKMQQGAAGSGRRCSHCQAQRTPQWRGGPLGPKTLCNACGVRYKSGRLHPEYRPAKSPTFVTLLHSNSHKRVMEMRMMNASSTTFTFPSSA